jgi:hypothetical protein
MAEGLYGDLFGYRALYGDIHNHSGISYGHGTLEDALKNARLQLDFCSVTGHYSWPDMGEKKMSAAVAEYHRKGFEKFRNNRDGYMRMLREAEEPGIFTPFVSFEMHSFIHGDYTVLARDFPPVWPDPENAEQLRQLLSSGRPESGFIYVPHHIGYKTGFRGINWRTYNELASPLVEILSMHGSAESEESSARYLHTMGPRDAGNSMQGGLAEGFHFGVTGSTDHHNSFPGSYGYGRTGVWSRDNTREALWDAFMQRRTFALTGDRMELGLLVEDAPMGSVVTGKGGAAREIAVSISGGYALDRVEIIKNGRILMRKNCPGLKEGGSTAPGELQHRSRTTGKIAFRFGWGEKGVPVEWNGVLRVRDGAVVGVEPRFRGEDIVDPLESGSGSGRCPSLEWKRGSSELSFSCFTYGNLTASTDNTQQISLELEADADTIIELVLDTVSAGKSISRKLRFPVREASQPRSEYVDGFISPAVTCGAFIPRERYTEEIRYIEEIGTESPRPEDWYYLRVFQHNGQAGWTSPVWVRR